MSNELYQEIQEHLKDMTSETPACELMETMEALIPKFSKLDPVKFERLWANLKVRLNFRGTYFTEVRRRS